VARIDTFRDPGLATWPRSGTVIFFDLEYTSWPGSLAREWSEPWEQREVVQIGAIAADVQAIGLKPLREFEQLVTPKTNPRLSGHFVELTGISNEGVARDGRLFPEAWNGFCRFCAGASQLWCMGRDGEVLRENFLLNKMEAQMPAPCYDIRPSLARVMGIAEEEVVSSRLPELAGLDPDGRAHQALDDARAVLKALDHLVRQGKLA
jgi:inhibitor of KinA sporulation pathway (predicted exonuclease)